VMDESAYVASLQVECRIARVATADKLDRISELFARTTQFNTTGRKFAVAELKAMLAKPDAHVFAMEVADRFGDHGLVGAAVVDGGEILGLVMSCRVLGLGVEHTFMRHVVDALAPDHQTLAGAIIATSRNAPVRHIFRDQGFVRDDAGIWHLRPGGAAGPVHRAVP